MVKISLPTQPQSDVSVTCEVCEENMFARYRDKLKCQSYWESIDGKHENRLKVKGESVSDYTVSVKDNAEVTLIIKWTFNAKHSSGKWEGSYVIDFVGIENTDAVLVEKDALYLLSAWIDWEVNWTIMEQVYEGAEKFGVEDYQRASNDVWGRVRLT